MVQDAGYRWRIEGRDGGWIWSIIGRDDAEILVTGAAGSRPEAAACVVRALIVGVTEASAPRSAAA